MIGTNIPNKWSVEMMNRHSLVAACVTAALLGACSNNDDEPISGSTVAVDPVERRLKAFETSEAFYGALKDALLNQGGTQNFDEGGPIALPVTAPEADAATESADADGASQATSDVTSTNVQEIGVDEQDRVKLSADGSRLYVLDNGYWYGGGEPLPVAEPDVVPEPGTDEVDPEIDQIEPAGTSLPAPEQSQPVLRIMSVDAETPDTQSLAEVSIDLEGGFADGFYLYETGSETLAFVTSTGSGYWANWSEPTAFAGLRSDISKVNLTDPSTAAVEANFRIDGQIVSSRRIGKHLFFASRYYPAIPGDQPWEQTAEQWQQTVENADLTTLLPQYSNADTGETMPLVDPAQCFVASKGADQPYYSPDIITLGVIDLDSMQLSNSQCFLGSTETLYASKEAIFLATTQYDYSEGPVTDGGVPVDVDSDVILVDEPWIDPRVDTDIHQFDINEGSLAYAGTGVVSGHLGWNPLRKPFRMSESNGYLRIATMNDQQSPDSSPILLHVLQADGQGNLNVVSRLPNESNPQHIGKPGEQLYASRFLGDRGYLVTFRQTDPLYVIDLADPANPTVAGELEIEGYSDYLYPIDAEYLLGIGRDAVAASDNVGDGDGALVQGIKLSLFDVSNPASPTEIQSVLVGQRGTDSVALYNHRAIGIQPANETHPLRVSFGIDVHGEAEPVASPPIQDAFNYYGWSYSGLHGFDIQTGPGAQIIRRGAVVAESVTTAGNPYGPLYGDDRSVMVDNAVFYIHGKFVYAANWNDLANPSDPR
jgi:uncharacterized secreted protein with C-terminal beta-propeller domain